MTTPRCPHISTYCWIITCFSIDTQEKFSTNKDFIKIYCTYVEIKVLHIRAGHVRNIYHRISLKKM